jgi:hypothetical protein
MAVSATNVNRMNQQKWGSFSEVTRHRPLLTQLKTRPRYNLTSRASPFKCKADFSWIQAHIAFPTLDPDFAPRELNRRFAERDWPVQFQTVKNVMLAANSDM